MAKSRQSFNRRERERVKKEKAAAKREKRFNKNAATDDDEVEDTEAETAEPVDEGEVIRQLAELNETFDAGDLAFEEFEKRRTELLAQLVVD